MDLVELKYKCLNWAGSRLEFAGIIKDYLQKFDSENISSQFHVGEAMVYRWAALSAEPYEHIKKEVVEFIYKQVSQEIEA